MVNTNCQQCSATTKAGNPCRRRTCRGNLCWTHLKMRKDLRVKDAPGMGLGLFTTRARFPGDLTDVKYTGTHLTGAQYHTLYPKTGPSPEYVICNNSETNCIDGKAVTSSFARFINHTDVNKANVAFKRFSKGPPAHFTMKAIRYIPAGGEMLANYGKEFRIV